jgi:hypothetical protein
MLPIVILGPVFQDDWGQMVGKVNAFLRLGSALNFVISPITYREFGLSGAAFTSFVVSVGMIVFGLLARTTYTRLKALTPTHPQPQRSTTVEESTGRQKDCYESSIAPLWEFGRIYWLYMLAGFFLYGAMVPFWFLGSKYLQLRFDFDVQWADALMLLPEGSIILLGPLLGIFLDRMKFTKKALLLQLAIGIALLPLGYLVLVGGPESSGAAASNINDATATVTTTASASASASAMGAGDDGNNGTNTTPIVPIFTVPSYLEDYHAKNDPHYASPIYAYLGMAIIGSAYAASNSLFWTLITSICSEEHLSIQTGIIASTMNVLPTVVPPLIVWINALYGEEDAKKGVYEATVAPSTRGINILAVLGAIGAIFAGLASVLITAPSHGGNDGDDDFEGNATEGEGERDAGEGRKVASSTVYHPISNESSHSEGGDLEMTTV